MLKLDNSRLFLDATWHFGELPDWFQVVPGPGKWKHPTYGEIAITDADLTEFAKNFKAGIYQEHIPIDAEHQTKLSGACGYFADVKVGGPNGEGGLWAKAEWNERGEVLLKEERYKYFSPEWYEEWEDPATGQKYSNVLIGGALTTRPFFKDPSLKPMVAGEGCIWCVENSDGEDTWDEMERVEATDPGPTGEDDSIPTIRFRIGGAQMGERFALMLTPEQVKSIKAKEDIDFTEDQLQALGDPPPNKAGEMPPDVAKTFTELRGDNDKLRGELKAASERVANMERTARRREFGEFVKANRAAFQGEVDANVDTLEKLAEHLPDDLFQAHLEEKHAFHERVMASGLFEQRGKGGPAPTSAEAEFNGKVDELIKTGKTASEATAMIANEHPDLYRRFDREHKAKVFKGGE